jgi:hypothetical protein
MGRAVEDFVNRANLDNLPGVHNGDPVRHSGDELISIPGTPPNMLFPPKGDAFAQRNKQAMRVDFEQEPPMFKITDTHYAATWLLHPNAPKVDMPDVVKKRIANKHKGGAKR